MLRLLDGKRATKDGAGHAEMATRAVRLVTVIVGVAALLGWSSIMIPTRVAMQARPADATGGQE